MPQTPGVTADRREDAAWRRLVSLSGSLDPNWGPPGDEVYAVDLSSMGGVIEEIGVGRKRDKRE